MIQLGTVFFVIVFFASSDYGRRHKQAIILTICSLPFFLYGQDECFDSQGDCTLANPVTIEIDVEVNCGDTVLLNASSELCNTWTVPPGLNYQFGSGQDSSSIRVVIDQCLEEPIIVDGITNTPSGSGTASCDTRLTYTLVYPVDTLEMGLPCADFYALPATSALLQSSCGCDSIFVEYFNLGGGDTTLLSISTCEPDEVGTSTQSLTASSGCDSLVITTTILDDLPELELSDQIVCEGEVITLYAFSDDALNYQWNTGATTEFLEVTEEGVYSVTITDANGCTSSASAQATYGDIAIALNATVYEPFLLSEQPLRVWQGAAIEFDVDVSGTTFSYEVLWNRGPEIGDTTFNYIAQESGEVTVAVIDSIGCIGTETLAFEVRPHAVFVPSAFSPNQDNINDWLHVYTSPNIEEVRLQIFSRTGSLIFDGVRLQPQPTGAGLIWQGWDGTFDGTVLPPQVFVYQLTYRSLRGEWQQLSGDVNLIH